jgi:hypothetical protein
VSLKTFSISFTIKVDEGDNILSVFDVTHEADIYDIIKNAIYDIDDVRIENLKVKERF